MFKKSTRSKNIRRKIETDDAVEENLGEETVVSQTITKVARKKKNNQQQRSLNLSFAEEEEADVEEFKVKKSNASLRMSLGRKLKLPGSAEDTENQPQSTNAYTSEYLETLRQSTPSMPAALKMAAATSKTGTADDDDDALLAEKFPSLMKAEVGEMSIPDAHAIHAAKKKRELARKGIVQDDDEDFIALDDPREHSRLVREEDEIGDDGEAEFEQYVGERITLDKRAAKKMERERLEGVREMIEEAQEKDEERSEDVERWEEDLIRHGGVKPVRQQERDPYAPPLGYKPALVPNQTAIPNLADTLKDLDLVCNGLEQTLKEFETQIEQKQQGITKLQGTEEDLNKEIQHESNRFDYFQPLANYVNDLGEFLDAKFPILESLEKEAHDIIATKHEVVRQRRWQDDLDDLRQFAYVSGNVDDKDESVRQRRQIERQQRLAVRQDISEMGDGPETLQAQGFWSDDDMGADWEAQRDTRLQEIQDKRIEEMLEDVGSEFSDLAIVQRRFEAWKTQFNDDYTKAFGALSLPAAFEFYIRCELVSWDPMSEPVDFHDWKWHRILSEYGVTEDQEDMEEDANTELLSKAVEKVIIKRLKSMLDTLNAASMREMRNLEKLVEEISYYVEKHERAYQDLLAAIEIAIDKQIKPYANLMDTIVLHPGEHNAESKQRFFWRQCKYLKTLQIWKRQLPSKALESLADTIINRIIAPILQPTSNPSDAELQKEALQIASRLK